MRCACAWLAVAWITANAPAADVTIATWNVGLIEPQRFNALELEDYEEEIGPDILLLQEVSSRELLNRLKRELDREDNHAAISSFAPGDGDLEVAILSRFPLANVIEYDRSPDNQGSGLEEQQLNRVPLAGIADTGVGRGFLAARVPDLKLFVVVTHLKSSRGRSGRTDHANAQKREFVAAAMAQAVHDLSEDFPDHTFLVAGDFNVGEKDAAKNGRDLLEDAFDGPDGDDGYDETHALLADGLVDGLKMRSLSKDLGETFVGDDDVPDFPGTGPIDCLYVSGPLAVRFQDAKRADTSFGSDHRSVYAVLKVTGEGSMEDGNGTVVTAALRIARLLPNPRGEDRGNESVTIANGGSSEVSLDGWQLRDKAGHRFLLSGTVSAGGERTFVMDEFEMPLNNNGDEVKLLDAEGIVRDRVSYSGDQVQSGTEIRFSR